MASKRSPVKASGQSHRAFQPVLPCGNKLLQQKWDQTYYKEHRRLVKDAKPMVDSKAPPPRPHVTSKLKKQQLEKERSDEIDRDNMTLLKKMQRIMKTEGALDHRNTYRHHSLNQVQRQREGERVVKENKELLKRLEKVQPIYRVSDWVDDWQKKEELTSRITAYPEATEESATVRSVSAKKLRERNAGSSTPSKEESSKEEAAKEADVKQQVTENPPTENEI